MWTMPFRVLSSFDSYNRCNYQIGSTVLMSLLTPRDHMPISKKNYFDYPGDRTRDLVRRNIRSYMSATIVGEKCTTSLQKTIIDGDVEGRHWEEDRFMTRIMEGTRRIQWSQVTVDRHGKRHQTNLKITIAVLISKSFVRTYWTGVRNARYTKMMTRAIREKMKTNLNFQKAIQFLLPFFTPRPLPNAKNPFLNTKSPRWRSTS